MGCIPQTGYQIIRMKEVMKLSYREWVLIAIISILLIKLMGVKKAIRDMTKQLKANHHQQALTKLKMSLIDQDVENLAECINNQIELAEQTRIKGQLAENERKRMIASISHDLRTPLTSIIGYIQVMRSNELSEQRKIDYLETTHRRAKDLQVLISDFFTLSLVESPEYQMNLQYLNIGNILCEVLANTYDRLIEKQITPQIDLPSESIRIIADEHALKRVFENLISNIIKHTTGEVIIKLYEEDKQVKLLLINQANGLIDKDVEHMFERFYTADASRGLNGGNTGLGLAIVKELMTKMGGTITSELKEEQLYIECVWEKTE
ncbi:MAG: sensor histidine kinase [Cellulosilyticaceae bacterium]